jgi:hypothetical protein
MAEQENKSAEPTPPTTAPKDPDPILKDNPEIEKAEQKQQKQRQEEEKKKSGN